MLKFTLIDNLFRKAKWAKLKDIYNEMDDESFHLPSSSIISSGEGTPRSASPAKTSPLKNQSPVKSNIGRAGSPIKTNSYTSTRFTSPEKRNDSSSNLSSPARVANVTAKPFSASPTRARGISPVKAPVSPTKSTSDMNRMKPTPDDSLVTSLKAQGFTETDSQSKLFYDFKETRRSSLSPTKGSFVPGSSGRERSVSPVKGKPVFEARSGSPLKTQDTRGRAPTRPTGRKCTNG